MMRNHVRRISHYVGQATAYNCMIHDVSIHCKSMCQFTGHPRGKDYFQVADEEHRTLQAGAQCSARDQIRTQNACHSGGLKRKGSEIRRLPSWRWWTTPTSSSSMSPSRILGLAMTWICNMQISSDIIRYHQISLSSDPFATILLVNIHIIHNRYDQLLSGYSFSRFSSIAIG